MFDAMAKVLLTKKPQAVKARAKASEIDSPLATSVTMAV